MNPMALPPEVISVIDAEYEEGKKGVADLEIKMKEKNIKRIYEKNFIFFLFFFHEMFLKITTH